MFTDPIKNLKQFSLHEDMIVADLGAGTGFYAIPVAKMVPQGKVYAIEVQKDFLTTVKNKAKEAHLNNLDCFWADIEKIGGTKIKSEVVDAVIASNIFSQVEEKDKFIQEIKRILKKEGRVLLIDWSDSSYSMGFNFKHLILKEKAREDFEQAGFVFIREIDTGPYNYGMIFRKK